MIAPLCALILIGVALLRDGFLKDLVEGPAVVLATSTAVVPASGAAPNASPSALISDAVSPPVTPDLQTGVEAYPIDGAPTTPAQPAATATNSASVPAAPTTVAPTQPIQPTATTAVNATPIPATPTPLGAATATPGAPTATPTAALAIGPSETPGPDGWWFRGINVSTVVVNEETRLKLMAEMVNNSTQNQSITGISVDITFSDGTTLTYSGKDELYWPTRDFDDVLGLPPQGRMPVDIDSFAGPEGATITNIAWHVTSTPGGAIGRTDFQIETLWSGMRGGQYYVDYKLTIPGEPAKDAVIVGIWGKNRAGQVIGVSYEYGNAYSVVAGTARDSLFFTPLSGDVVETYVIAVWGQ